MQTSKISLLICTGAVCAVPFLSHAADTEEQSRLRALLRQSMTGTTTTAPADSNSAPTTPAEPATPPSKTIPMEVSTPVIPPTQNPDADAKLRDALHRAMTGTTATVPPAEDVVVVPPPAAPEAPVASTPEPAPVVPTVESSTPVTEAFQEPAPMTESPNDAKLQEALHQAMAARDAREAAAASAETEVTTAPAAVTSTEEQQSMTTTTVEPMTSPTAKPPISPTVEPMTTTTVEEPKTETTATTPEVVVEPAPIGETRVIENPSSAVIEQPVVPSVTAEMPEPMTITNTEMAESMTITNVEMPETMTNTLTEIPETMTNAVVEAPAPEQMATETNATEAAQQVMQQSQTPVMSHELSPENKQRLKELTAQYMADKISPEEYHRQRAQIVAAP